MEIIANTPTPKLVLVIFQFQPLHGLKIWGIIGIQDVLAVRGPQACNGLCWSYDFHVSQVWRVLALRKLFHILSKMEPRNPYLWLVGNGRMVVIVLIIVPHSSIPY